jgi:metal-responsive CopG/Arc/MetJ family transcriptional regulator
MRTTVNLDKDILRVADKLAESRAISRGEALSELVRRGVRHAQKPLPTKPRNGFAVLDLAATAKFSSEDVASALGREDADQASLHS